MKRTILVVEDNAPNMRLFADVLESAGYIVLKAERGMQGLDLARAHRPDLVVMDIQLPDVSGLEVIRSLKEDAALRNIPVLAVTAFAMKGDEQIIREAGSNGYMAKPISVHPFLAAVAELLSRAEQAATVHP